MYTRTIKQLHGAIVIDVDEVSNVSNQTPHRNSRKPRRTGVAPNGPGRSTSYVLEEEFDFFVGQMLHAVSMCAVTIG